MQGLAATSSRAPAPGDHAAGHGLEGIVESVPDVQPLAHDHVWRVTLVGEECGRLVTATPQGAWHLLQLDELTDAQLDVLEAATERAPPLC
jgi:hypothetical protein